MRSLFLIIGALFLFSPLNSFALNVVPASPYNFTASNTAYYWCSNCTLFAGTAVLPSSPNFLDTSAGFRAIDLSGVGGSGNAIFFDVSTSETFTVASGQHLVVSVLAQDSSENYNIVPIHFAEATSGTPADCTTTSCNKTSGMADGGYREANLATHTTLRIGVYIKSICDTQSATKGCSVVAPIQFPLRIVAWVTDDSNAVQTYTSGGDTSDAIVQFHQSLTASTSCPGSNADFSQTYFPGDGSITLSPSRFSFGPLSSGAPVANLIAVANLSPASPTRASNYTTSGVNSVVTIGDATAQQIQIGTFLNKSVIADNLYNIAFMFRDVSGAVYFTDGTCSYSGVQTSGIEGFLTGNKCFIATLAYGSEDHFFVKTLRKFRNAILLKSEIGKNLVRSYYRISPRLVAELSHYEFSRPVLQEILFPVVCGAFFFMNPLWMVLGVSAVMGLYFFRRKNAG